nr:MAG TPA: NADH dehydrogenase I subunit E, OXIDOREDUCTASE [Bacteriophage sp.]
MAFNYYQLFKQRFFSDFFDNSSLSFNETDWIV